MKSRQSGFTLIELVVVIIILGILAAVAAPKFVNLQGSARAASLNGLRAAVSSASTLANALQTASGLATNASVTMDGSTVAMVNGYPAATAGGIVAATNYDTSAYSSLVSGSVAFWVTSASNSGTCTFSYTAATTTVSAAVGASSTAGC